MSVKVTLKQGIVYVKENTVENRPSSCTVTSKMLYMTPKEALKNRNTNYFVGLFFVFMGLFGIFGFIGGISSANAGVAVAAVIALVCFVLFARYNRKRIKIEYHDNTHFGITAQEDICIYEQFVMQPDITVIDLTKI